MPGTTVIEVPQWQGSARPGARGLAAGAARLAAGVAAQRRLTVAVPQTDGNASGGVRGLDVLVEVRDRMRAELMAVGDHLVVTVGGDCGVELAAVSRAIARHGRRLAVVWFDAHPDLNTPESSPSHGFHGMVLRTLCGDGPESLRPADDRRLFPEQVVLAGTRAIDPAEADFIAARGMWHLPVDALTSAEPLVEAVEATGATAVYLHVDVDVLEPEQFSSISCPEPGGLRPRDLCRAVAALRAYFPLAGLGITEYLPAAGSRGGAVPDGDLQVLLALLEAAGVAVRR